jgi:DNA-binding MarR family transcriptional regulator
MASSSRANLADRLHSLSIHLLRHAREADRSSGLGPARLSALSVLVFGGPCTLGALADAEQVSRPTMTAIVQGLEADGLARRVVSKEDARSFVIRATTKGETVLNAARQARLQRIESTLAPATEADVRALSAALDRVFPQ